MATKTVKKSKKSLSSFHGYDNEGMRSLEIVMDSSKTKVVGLSNNSSRYIYFQKKEIDKTAFTQDEDEDNCINRIIVVKGIPNFYTESDIQEIFEMFGEVETVFFRLNDNYSGKVAEVMFEGEESINKAFSSNNAKSYITGSGDAGLSKYKSAYMSMRPDYSKLQAQVDMFMLAFDERTETEKDNLRKKVSQLDEDGFQYVTYKLDKNKKRSRNEKDSVKRYNKKMNQKVNTLFSYYKFQEEEKLLEKKNALRQKFIEDKKRIQDFKNRRTFTGKPL